MTNVNYCLLSSILDRKYFCEAIAAIELRLQKKGLMQAGNLKWTKNLLSTWDNRVLNEGKLVWAASKWTMSSLKNKINQRKTSMYSMPEPL